MFGKGPRSPSLQKKCKSSQSKGRLFSEGVGRGSGSLHTPIHELLARGVIALKPIKAPALTGLGPQHRWTRGIESRQHQIPAANAGPVMISLGTPLGLAQILQAGMAVHPAS